MIPTYARPHSLRQCLNALAKLDAPALPFEVIVVDDGSPAPLDTVVAEFADCLNIRLISQLRGGPGNARNSGAAAAAGRFLAFIDDDCRAAPSWLTALLQEFTRDDRRLLGGKVENGLPNNLYSEASESITRFVYEYNLSGAAREPFFTTNNIAVSADLFRELGGFTTTIPSATAEDKEFCDRWRERGWVLAHVPAAVVFHAHPLNFRRFLHQHFNYGRGILAFRLMRRNRSGGPARSGDSRQAGAGSYVRQRSTLIPESFMFYARLLLSPLSRGKLAPWWRIAALQGLLVVSQVSTLAGAIREAMRWQRLEVERTKSRQAS